MREAKWDMLSLAMCVFVGMIIIVKNESPVHKALLDTRPIHPVTPLNVPVLVINLDRNTDRLKTFMRLWMDSDFKNQTVSRLPAVDGKAVDLDKVVAKKALPALMHTMMTDRRTSHEQLTVGAVGCYLSHMSAWETILKSGKPYGFVFEDDGEVGRHALRKTIAAMKALPKSWHIMLMGTACLSECPKLYRKPIKRVFAFVRFHAYIISREGCEFLLGKEARMLPMSMQVDWKISELARKKKIRVYTTTKMLCDSGWQGTEIQRPVYPA